MIVVTGANGFIGSAMVWELNQAGETDIVAVDSVSLGDRSEPLKKLQYKEFLSHDELLQKMSEPVFVDSINGIFHMGACSSTSEMNREYLKENNTEYTRKLFEACIGKDIPYIYASSGAVYGNGQNGFSDAMSADQLTPLNPYGESKVNFDAWALAQSKTPRNWYGLRFFNVYGPNEYHKQDMCSVVYKAFMQINEGGQLKLFKSHHSDYADGEQMRDFVYVKDITRWMLEIYRNSSMQSGIYNLGFGEARTWLDLAKNVFLGMNKEMKIKWIDTPTHLRDQYQYYTKADIGKLKEQGLSAPQWSLEDGIKDYVGNYLLTEDPYL